MALIGCGYALLALIVVALAFAGNSVLEAVGAIKEPLMALVGGSLALSKDLISDDDGPGKCCP